jgi:preprotein translocase subunit SecE
MATKVKRPGLVKFFKSVVAELKKVSWPNRKELTNYTLVVLFMGFITAVGIWVFDTFFRSMLTLFL